MYVVVYEEGVTPGVGAGAGISAELGVGADATVPADDWTWSACTYNGDMDGPTPGDTSNDEYQCVATAPAVVGSYDYAGRVSIDGGPWLNCDLGPGLGGSGSSDGYSVDTTGTLTVE